MAFILASPAFGEGDTIPVRFTADGDGVSPELAWGGAPEETQSFALIMHDPDAPKGDFVHWLLWDIPATESSLAEGAGNTSAGALGKNSHDDVAYLPPSPPPGHGSHRYIFELYALDVATLNLPRGATRDKLVGAMRSHVLGGTQFMGRYERVYVKAAFH